jgi:hypothetical protein
MATLYTIQHRRLLSAVPAIILIFSFLCTTFLSNQIVFATDQVMPKGLTVSPLRTDLALAPGTSFDGSLEITNSTDRPMTVNLSVEEFSVIDPQYDYSFNATTKLTKWVTFTPSTLDLAVGQSVQAKFKVGVPAGAEPGGRYLSMFATTDTSSQSEGVASQQRIASLIYLTVNGDFTRSGKLVSFSAPWFLTGGSEWSASLHNTGTTHYNSRYSVSVQTLLGDKTISETNGSSLILPGTIRSIKDSITLPSQLGIYKAVYTIGLGDSPAVVETRYFIYLPPVAGVVLIFSVIVIISLIAEYRYRKTHRKSN